MIKIFLSYSSQDHYFAELALIKLKESEIDIWRDHGQLKCGDDWRGGIERGISESMAVVVALSEKSVASSYVTFEWAYGLGKGKPVIPLKLDQCSIHPRLEPIQYLDFSMQGALPWIPLVERIQEIESEGTSEDDTQSSIESSYSDPMVKAILAYINQRGYQMVTYDRIRKRINDKLTNEDLDIFVEENKSVFRKAVLKNNEPGLAKLIP